MDILNFVKAFLSCVAFMNNFQYVHQRRREAAAVHMRILFLSQRAPCCHNMEHSAAVSVELGSGCGASVDQEETQELAHHLAQVRGRPLGVDLLELEQQDCV